MLFDFYFYYCSKGGLESFFLASRRHFQIRKARPIQPETKVNAPLILCHDSTQRVELGAAAMM
jgi:hypothetical protein